MPDTLPFVTIVIPTLNEENYIEGCLASITAGVQDIEHELFVVDGGSTDRTVEIASKILAHSPNGRVLHNPARLQSAAVNLAANRASSHSSVILRADAHATYPVNFVRTCLMAMRDHEATSVVVPMITVGRTGLQRAIAAAQNSRLGNGGSAHRTGGQSKYVDHGHHAAIDKQFFLGIGGYNESFSHNEDAEFDIRAVRAGGKIWMCTQAPVSYFPRTSLIGVSRQYFRHGRGRASTVLRHQLRPKARQLAPVILLVGTLCSLAASVVEPWFLGLPLGYVAICFGWSGMAASKAADPWLLAAAPALMTMHFSWGAGFLLKIAGHLTGGAPAAPAKAAPPASP